MSLPRYKAEESDSNGGCSRDVSRLRGRKGFVFDIDHLAAVSVSSRGWLVGQFVSRELPLCVVAAQWVVIEQCLKQPMRLTPSFLLVLDPVSIGEARRVI